MKQPGSASSRRAALRHEVARANEEYATEKKRLSISSVVRIARRVPTGT